MKTRPSKIKNSSRGWMSEFGLRRSFFKQTRCPRCGQVRQQKYVLHPFPLPKPHSQGEWLFSDCACVTDERLQKRQDLEKMQVQRDYEPLPRSLRSHNFRNFKVANFNRDAHAACRNFARNFGKIKKGQGILLYGSPGTGKTHLAAAIANSLKKQYSVSFVYVPGFLLEQNWRSFSLQGFLEGDLLILDDFGNGSFTDFDGERLLMIVEGRLNNLKSTVFTSNYDLKDLEKRVGTRMTSRLRGNNVILHLQGPDWRAIN